MDSNLWYRGMPGIFGRIPGIADGSSAGEGGLGGGLRRGRHLTPVSFILLLLSETR